VDIVLAYRQAKNVVATQRGAVGLFELARFERSLATSVRATQRRLAHSRWFNDIPFGTLVAVPKSSKPSLDEPSDVVRIGTTDPHARVKLNIRLQIMPSPAFAVAEILYLWKFGPALESVLMPSCVGYRLQIRRGETAVDTTARSIFAFWPAQFRRYRDEPIAAARDSLAKGNGVVVVSTDVSEFYDSIDPRFLISPAFVTHVTESAQRLGRTFDRHDYRVATTSLLEQFAAFRRQRQRFGQAVDTTTGIPIGAVTSTIFANLSLAAVDSHIESIPGVICYRRYVDDIVVVMDRASLPPAPIRKAEALASIFPEFSAIQSEFTAPFTDTAFRLNSGKTLVHDLSGPAGLDFLGAIQESFAAVTSERRAFFGDVAKLETDIEAVDLFGEGGRGTDHVPRLRDADRFTLKRFMATAVVRGVERCALLLDRKEASTLLEERIGRLLSILDNTLDIDDFEFALSLLRAALLCDCKPVIQRIVAWLGKRTGELFVDRVDEVVWHGHTLAKDRALSALQWYLRRRVDEGIASACAVSRPGKRFGTTQTRRRALSLHRSGLRHLDNEDDATVFGAVADWSRSEHATVRRELQKDEGLKERLRKINAFIRRSIELDENIWTTGSDVSLLLSLKPPTYFDVARRFLARAEKTRISPEVGIVIDSVVDALRGTRYLNRRRPTVGVSNGDRSSVVRVNPASQPSEVRVILSNLPNDVRFLTAAAKGRPISTLARLQGLDKALRDARRASRQRKPAVLVIPELAVPQRWARALAIYALNVDLSVVAGLEYEAVPHGLVNQAVGVFSAGRQSGAIVRWTKRNPARAEEQLLGRLGKRLAPAGGLRRLIVDSAHGRIGVLICSEILEADALATLSGYVEVVLVPAWNDDTTSFEHVLHAAALMVHAFVCIANNAEASDSRIVAPIKTPRYERDWCRLVHRKENQIVWGDLPTHALRRLHDGRTSGAPSSRKLFAPREFRPLPPGWGPD
jgi:predicted amidohydrolase